MNIPILYEDNHLLVVEKPVNIPVQQDDSNDQDLQTILKNDLKVRYNKPGNVYLSIVHRLDRPVGGVILFAKTSKAASRMSDILRKQELNREYMAIVRGNVRKSGERLSHYLYKNKEKNQVYVVKSNVKGAKKAILNYETKNRSDELSLLQVTLQTGRSHQIRVQLSEMGFPLFGDQKYGSKVNKHGQQIALWAHTLTFKHPTKDETITVKSNPPNVYPWNVFL